MAAAAVAVAVAIDAMDDYSEAFKICIHESNACTHNKHRIALCSVHRTTTCRLAQCSSAPAAAVAATGWISTAKIVDPPTPPGSRPQQPTPCWVVNLAGKPRSAAPVRGKMEPFLYAQNIWEAEPSG